MNKKAGHRGPLPLMKSVEDAVALCGKEQDNFYVTAFMIEAWLGGLTLDAVTQYAEKKSAIDRRLQTGRARQLFEDTFDHAKDAEFLHIFQSICRFSEHDDLQSEMVLQAFACLSFEESPPKPPQSKPTREEALAAIARARRIVSRLCDWLEAIVHWQTHLHYHLSPVSFDPDPAKRPNVSKIRRNGQPLAKRWRRTRNVDMNTRNWINCSSCFGRYSKSITGRTGTCSTSRK